MRGSKAKKIRKLVYGDLSKRNDERYYRTPDGNFILDPKGKRKKYKDSKKLAKMGVRVG